MAVSFYQLRERGKRLCICWRIDCIEESRVDVQVHYTFDEDTSPV